jgi:two-component system OmpR family response regulator
MTQVLIVDDDAGIRQLLLYACSMEGYSVATLADGREVVARLRAAEDRVVVLMDIMMPNMDGMAVCAQLADEPALFARHVIILMSAAFPPEEPLPIGVRGALPKPFHLERVWDLLQQWGAEPPAEDVSTTSELTATRS